MIIHGSADSRYAARGGLGRLAALHLPGGPVDPVSRWAAKSNVEVGQTTCPLNRRRVEREGREGSEEQSHKEEEMKGGGRIGEVLGTLILGERALFGY